MSGSSMITESTWGPCESASKSRSRWASDARQSQPDQWSDSSAKWMSSAGDDNSWKQASEWEGSQWSAPTKWTLKGSDYDVDREWHSRNMKYDEGWACNFFEGSTRERSLQELLLRMIERQIP